MFGLFNLLIKVRIYHCRGEGERGRGYITTYLPTHYKSEYQSFSLDRLHKRAGKGKYSPKCRSLLHCLCYFYVLSHKNECLTNCRQKYVWVVCRFQREWTNENEIWVKSNVLMHVFYTPFLRQVLMSAFDIWLRRAVWTGNVDLFLTFLTFCWVRRV